MTTPTHMDGHARDLDPQAAGPQETPAWPDVIRWNWNNHHAETAKAAALERGEPGLADAIAKARAEHDRLAAELTRVYNLAADLEEQAAANTAAHAAATTNAQVSRELVTAWCASHDMPLPPIPDDIPLEQTGAFPAIPPGQVPAQAGRDLTDTRPDEQGGA